MTPELYRVLHVLGALALFLGLGGALSHEPGKAPKIFVGLHGLGLLALIVAGIGVAHRTNLGWPNWLIAKMGVWVLLGALPMLVRRAIINRFLGLLLALGLGGAAAWLAITKPF
jgi:hypothetical protein